MSDTSRLFEVLKFQRPPTCGRMPILLKVIASVFLIVHETVFVNIVFRVQYKLTVIILLSLSIVVTFGQTLWSPIKCSGFDPVYNNGLCYSFPPYSNSEAFDVPFEDIPYPGIGTGPPREYHHYYQWVSSMLFIQAMLFVIPWYFWRTIEVRREHDVVKELKDTSKEKFNSFSDEITSSTQNWSYLAFFLATDILNILNVIGQIFLMDSFLGGNFLTYGSDVIGTPLETLENPYSTEVRVFPSMAKCDFKQYDSSGYIQRHSTVCFLRLNVLYRKIYFFLWFYFIVLATTSCFSLVYHFVLLLVTPLREMILVLFMRLNTKTAESVNKSLNVGAWFYLYNLSRNLNPSSQRQLNVFLSENFAIEKSISVEMEQL